MTLDEAIEFGMPCVELVQDAEWCEVALETMKKYQELVSNTIKMREATPEERESINKYIKSIGKLTGVDFWNLEQEPRWIPCSERMPKAGECVGLTLRYYLVQNEYGDMMVARYTHSGYWEQMYQHEPCADEIVAWMPLPEPYKAESDVLKSCKNCGHSYIDKAGDECCVLRGCGGLYKGWIPKEDKE